MVKYIILLSLPVLCFGQYVDDLDKITVSNVTTEDSVNIYAEMLNGSSALTAYKLPLDTLRVWVQTNLDSVVLGDSTFKQENFTKYIAQYHRIDTVDVAGSDWTLVQFDTSVTSETTQGYAFNGDSTGFVVSFSGVVRVQGCLHAKNNNAGSQTGDVAARVLVNSTEARCLQSLTTFSLGAGDFLTLPYVGTVAVSTGDTIKVQYRMEDTDFDLECSTWFDNPVAASVNFERMY